MVASKAGVVVTAADLATDRAIARSLKGLQVELVGLCEDEKSPFVRSRYWDRIICMGKQAEPGDYLETLRELGQSVSRPMVLFPTQDHIVQLVSDHRDELGQWFAFALPPKEMVDTFLDKTRFHPWATARGFPVPDSRLVSSREEFDSALNDLGYPVILKPLYKTVDWERHGRDKAYRFAERSDFTAFGSDPFEDAPRFVVQRWVDGDDADVHFCLTCWSRESEQLGYYTGRKLLQRPIGTGSTAVCVGTENEFVYELTREILGAGECRGLASVEFKYSHRDGNYYVTEPTVGRPNLQSYVATVGGVNLIETAYWIALGKEPTRRSRRRKAIWIEEGFTRDSLPRMTESRGRLLKTVARAILGGAPVSFAYFELSDPFPFLAWCRRMAAGVLSQRRSKTTLQKLATKDIEPNVPPGAVVIFVDKGVGMEMGGGRRCVPFPERDGEWAGYPANDDEAIMELERLQALGAAFVVVPSWMRYWLDVYPGLAEHLRERGTLRVDNSRGLIYQLS
jgi:D-aspartate ligase